MKIILVVALLLLISLGYSAYTFMRKVRVSRELVEKAVPFMLKGERGVSVLVLGDSTAVGVGAESPQGTLAALVAEKVNATQVDNFAASGAQVQDLAKQVQNISKEKYNFILIGIGANDVIRFRDPDDSAEHLSVILAGLPVRDKLIVYMAGNVGATTLFPRIINPLYTRRTVAFHTAFSDAVSRLGGTYVNLYTDPALDPFTKSPEVYLAVDGLHPTSAGYKLWFERISAALDG